MSVVGVDTVLASLPILVLQVLCLGSLEVSISAGDSNMQGVTVVGVDNVLAAGSVCLGASSEV